MTALVVAALAGCKKGDEAKSEPEPAAQPSIALPTKAEVPAVESDELRGAAGVKLPQATVDPPDTSGSATRCTIEPVLAPSECDIHVARDVGVDASGGVYFVDGQAGVRRYVLDPGEGCVLRADSKFGTAGLWPQPALEPEGQSIDGPVHMRSGGPKFGLAAASGDSMYAYDYLGGAHRVHGKAKVSLCDGVMGISGLAFVGTRMLAAQGKNVVELEATRKGCKVGKTFSDVLSPNAIASDGDGGLIVGGRADGNYRVARIDKGGKALWTVGNDDAFADDGMCSISAVTRCGDAICVADGNCKKILRFETVTGKLLGTDKYSTLFGDKAYQLHGFSHPFATITLKTRTDDAETCEAAIFRLD